jgi:Tachylectin
LAQDRTDNWAKGGTVLKIGQGWNNFLHVFSGGDVTIYAVTQSGDLLWYKDLARDGTANWGGNGIKLGEGWTFE